MQCVCPRFVRTSRHHLNDHGLCVYVCTLRVCTYWYPTCVFSFPLCQVMSELTTKDNGGWVPLMFASRSGNRFVFMAAMQAFIDRGEEGSRVVSGGRKRKPTGGAARPEILGEAKSGARCVCTCAVGARVRVCVQARAFKLHCCVRDKTATSLVGFLNICEPSVCICFKWLTGLEVLALSSYTSPIHAQG